MKYQILISLVIITVSFSYINTNYVHEGKHFLKGFLTSIEGKEVQLDDSCLGHETEELLDKIESAIRKENSISLLTSLYETISLIEKKCPSEEIKKILKDSKEAYESRKMLYNATNNSRDFMHDLHQLLDERNPEKVGKLIGNIVNICVYNKLSTAIENLTFLGIEMNDVKGLLDMGKKEVELFVDGFFEGVSKVPYEQNKCHKELDGFQEDIVQAVTNLINALKTKTNIIDSFKGVYELAQRLMPLNENCHFSGLSIQLMALSTKPGIAKLVFNLTTSPKQTYTDIKEIYSGVEANDFRAAGVSYGKLLKLGLNYSTQ
jgi:hypothetical protein